MEGARKDVHVQGSPVHCPYCKDGLEDLAKVVACAACGARHHSACHSEHGRCAACGEPQVLVPRAPSPGGLRRRLEPLAGSRIRVEQDGSGVRYVWTTKHWGMLFVAFLFLVLVLTAPLAIAFLVAYLRDREQWVRVDAEGIEFVTGFSGTKVIRARWADVGAIKAFGGNLTIDVGIKRHIVGILGALQFILKAPEIDWLVEALQAWKNEH